METNLDPKQFTQVWQFTNWAPKFFSRENNRFFGTGRKIPYRGLLILVNDHGLGMSGRNRVYTFPIYQPIVASDGANDMMWIGSGDSVADAKAKIANGEIKLHEEAQNA